MAELWDAMATNLGSASGPAEAHPHEIHITIAPPDQPRLFLATCEELGVRPCVFDNEFANGQHMTDFLTASDHHVKTSEARDIMRSQAQAFTERGFTVVRQKIETTPTNPIAPRLGRHDEAPPMTSYYETHFDVDAMAHTWLGRLSLIEYMGPHDPVLLSVNRRKPDEFLVTYRRYGVYLEEFMPRLERVQAKLAARYHITPSETEFACYDSAPSHDHAWVSSYERVPELQPANQG